MPIPLNRWSHIVVTYPQGGQSSDTKVYLNGTLVTGCTNNTVGPVDTVDGGNPYTLGNRNYGSNEPFSGLLDEVAIYNRTLNATEVGLLYNNGAPLAYGYVAGPAIANESIGRQAILQGIQSSSVGSSFTAAYDRQVYTSIANGSQYNGRFDLFVQSGNKRWAFNYDQNTTASFPVFVNITPVFYVWQMANMPNATIVGSVSSFINSTN
jgi:hypothetical protein